MARQSNTARQKADEVTVALVTEVVEGMPEVVEAAAAEAEAASSLPKIETVDISACGDNKSAKIRLYAGLGYERAVIARHLGIKYQFVRNVLMQPAPVKKA